MACDLCNTFFGDGGRPHTETGASPVTKKMAAQGDGRCPGKETGEDHARKRLRKTMAAQKHEIAQDDGRVR